MDELSRLHALDSYQLLDTLPQKELDEITEIASIICGTPTSLITLIDSDRQWFKSRIGFDIAETPREYAFCHHTIQSPESILIVEDSFLDERFKDNPLATGNPFIRFYAGAPLVTSDGHALGSLCVIDNQPRTLTQEQQRALTLLGKGVMDLFELRKANLESERLYESSKFKLFTLTEPSPDLIATLSDALIVLYINRSTDTFSRECMLGKSGLDLIEPSFQDEFRDKCQEVFMKGEQSELDMKLSTPKGCAKWVTCRIAPLRGDLAAEATVIMVCTEITERKLHEERNKKYVESLEKVMYMISHRLRSPVSKIIGLANILNNEQTSFDKKLQCIAYLSKSALEVDEFTRELTEFIDSSRVGS